MRLDQLPFSDYSSLQRDHFVFIKEAKTYDYYDHVWWHPHWKLLLEIQTNTEGFPINLWMEGQFTGDISWVKDIYTTIAKNDPRDRQEFAIKEMIRHRDLAPVQQLVYKRRIQPTHEDARASLQDVSSFLGYLKNSNLKPLDAWLARHSSHSYDIIADEHKGFPQDIIDCVAACDLAAEPSEL